MKNLQKICWILRGVAFLGLLGSAYAETEYKLERYRVILDRSPFGSEPLTATVTAPDVSAQQQAVIDSLSKTCRLSFLLQSEAGEIRAGFQNLKPQKGKSSSSIIRIGESFMGMKLTAVDMLHSEAELLYNGKPITFKLSKDLTQNATTKAAPPASNGRKFGRGFRRPEPKKKKPPEPKLSPEEQRLRREEIRKNLLDYQMHVIRSGMPPLPIPLTQEMDDQLVSEGVLPSE